MKIAPRTKVSDEFVEAMLAAYTMWLEAVAQRQSDRRALKSHSATVQRLLPIVRRESPNLRMGLDYELTRLRGMPMQELTTYTHGGMTYMVAHTRHITLRDHSTHAVRGELGCYNIFIPQDIFIRPDLGHLHLIPDLNRLAVFRHPHHYTHLPPNMARFEPMTPRIYQQLPHPLERRTGNCYGSYAGPLKGMLDDPDLPELLRQINGHLCTYGVSPPVHMGELDFDHDTPEA